MVFPTTGMGTHINGKVVRRGIIKNPAGNDFFDVAVTSEECQKSLRSTYTLSDRPHTAETMSHGHPDLQDGHTNSQDECDVRYTPHSAVVTKIY